MAELLDLWSPEIRVDVLSPYTILQMQAGFLKKRTGGIIDAIVDKTENAESAEVTLDVVATALNHRERVLTAIYTAPNKPYPVKVEAIGIRDKRANLIPYRWASTEEGFMNLLRESLQSEEMNTLIQSLIARTNEKRPFGSQPPTLPPSLLKPITPERKSNLPATPKKPPDATEGDADK
jgi:hypothetical protein